MLMNEKKESMTQTFRAMLITALGYGILAGLFMFLTNPLIPILFGSEYSGATETFILLAVWPFVFALRQTLSAWFTANDRDRKSVV